MKYTIKGKAGYLTSYSAMSTSWGPEERAKSLDKYEVIEAMKTILDMGLRETTTIKPTKN